LITCSSSFGYPWPKAEDSREEIRGRGVYSRRQRIRKEINRLSPKVDGKDGSRVCVFFRWHCSLSLPLVPLEEDTDINPDHLCDLQAGLIFLISHVFRHFSS